MAPLFPDDIIIKFISDFCICRFKDNKHLPEAPPHYYVNVPIDDDSSLLLCIITSQIEKREKFYTKANKKALKSLVYVDDGTLSLLTKKSIIDCNKADLITKTELQNRIDPKSKIEVKEGNLSDNLKIQIVRAINNSPLINDYTKKRLKP
ncbi:MAG: hypothetical protein ACUZ8H_16305 [Candidatus Anammoxibacter sp.]